MAESDSHAGHKLGLCNPDTHIISVEDGEDGQPDLGVFQRNIWDLRTGYIKPLAHSLVNIDGVEFDVAHHGPGAGIRQWTRGNQARYYLRSLMWQEFKAGNRPAKVYLRGHYHTFVHEVVSEQFCGETFVCHLIVLPSWCGMTEYARQATHSQYEVTNGMVAFEIVNGELVEVHPFYRTLDLRVKESL